MRNQSTRTPSIAINTKEATINFKRENTRSRHISNVIFVEKIIMPIAVLKDQIKRYEEVEKVINACTYTHFKSAFIAAEESEQRYRKENPRALEGITVALKDEYDVKGWFRTAGSKVLKKNMTTNITHPKSDPEPTFLGGKIRLMWSK